MIVAFGIGGIEVLAIVADRFGLRGGAWDWVANLDFGVIGLAIVAIFVLSWGISTLIYRWKRYDDLPVDPSPTGASTTGASTPA